ncbi:hydrolase [Paenibacillus sp. HJL G12]|uniref:Hydrolase n=1 Tax=Paenibacillus dendrobii TaxID=2691084 RepID=A0A7X3LJN6_9BACL|nr:HAD family hydrolase [Paenibacillus dendrobii]MWV45728.1 hydrolase [Paenibacillus dendrobii]
MIFASDLDRTLIYSMNAMGDDYNAEACFPVESSKENDRYISFMSKVAARLLRELSASAYFIPVTTRTVEQYRRIFYLNTTICPEYAITSNGGNILVRGVPDEEWNAVVRAELRKSASASQVFKRFEDMASPSWVLRTQHCEELFYAIVINREAMPILEVEELRADLAAMGWGLSVQGRKIYLVPSGLSKGKALKHLMDRLEERVVAAAGDSLLDESLLETAMYKLAPSHGELFSLYGEKGPSYLEFTKHSGLTASEEIIRRVMEWFSIQSSVTQFAYSEGQGA